MKRYYSCLSKKLIEPSASPKTLMKSFHNKKYPVFHQFFTEIDLLQISKKKPNYLILLFLLSNFQSYITVKSPLSCIIKPINLYQISHLLKKDAEKKLHKNLDWNKAHGHDMISMRILKISGKSIIKPLRIIYKKCLEKGCFRNEWKKANVAPVQKNGKQLLKNYRPIYLLPICGKFPERFFSNSMFEFFIQNNLITPKQSGFKTGGSCIQLISITHELCKSFDDGYVILDISTAFDNVWYQVLHYKLRQNGISGELLNTLTDYLDNRTQRVILNGQYSSWA